MQDMCKNSSVARNQRVGSECPHLEILRHCYGSAYPTKGVYERVDFENEERSIFSRPHTGFQFFFVLE